MTLPRLLHHTHPLSVVVRSFSMPTTLPKDIRAFLEDYPRESSDDSESANLEFYTNKRRCRPDNILLRQIHER